MNGFEGKVIKCRAAVAWKPKEKFTIEEVEVAPPKKGEVRIKMVSVGVCHSDWHVLSGKELSWKFPIILGHEGAGIVESVGENVTSVKAGDHVIPLYTPQCYNCKFCKSPKTNLCEEKAFQAKGAMNDGTSRFTCKGQTLSHFMGCSSFSEYTVCTESSVAKINENAPLNKVCLLGCAIPTGYGAAVKIAQVEAGSTVAIWGMGGVGLSAVMGAKNAGAKRIIGVDINSDKEEMAKKFGCTDFVNPKNYSKPLPEVLIEMTGGGVDYAIECCGSAFTMRQAFESLHKGWGVAVAIGLVESGQEVSFIPYHLCQGRIWKGSSFGGWKGRDEVPFLVDEYLNGKIKVDEFITGYMKLEEINEAFEKMITGKAIRTILEF